MIPALPPVAFEMDEFSRSNGITFALPFCPRCGSGASLSNVFGRVRGWCNGRGANEGVPCGWRSAFVRTPDATIDSPAPRMEL